MSYAKSMPCPECHLLQCEKKGHFAKCCRDTSAAKISAFSTPKLCAIQPAPPCLSYATITSFINGRKLSTLIDSGSSLSFINEKTARSLGLTIEPRDEVIAMAWSNLTCRIQENCTVDLMLHNQKYSQVNLEVIKGLCTDVLLGGDFQAQHERLVFQHNGSKSELVVPNNSDDHISTVCAANLKPVSLFNNLLSECRSIATKSRQFNAKDREFIAAKITKMQSSGVIRPSHSPWRAQALVVTNKESGKRRMCIDYSQTINLFADLDAYPLPSIESLVNKLSLHKVFSTFDLKSAYYQIPIRESDEIYTAFEACGKLWEFNRIPFGVTNGVPQFQRVIGDIVMKEGLKDTYPYLDSVTIGGTSQEEHDNNVQKFLDAIARYGMELNQSKTVSSVSEVCILGYCVGGTVTKSDQILKDFDRC